MKTLLLLGVVVAAVKYRTFRWVAAVLLAIAFWKVAVGLFVVAVALRAGWHGWKAVRTANEARRRREAELAARCDLEDRLLALGDPRGTYGL